jgi:MSHA biogenesis protein MshI
VVGRSEAIHRHVEDLDAAKCPLEVVDVPELAQRNIAELVEEEGRGMALLSFDDSGGLLTFTYLGELYATRHIDIPLSALQAADSEQRQRYFDRIALELQRSFDNFERQFSHISLSKLMLAALPDEVNLEAYLSSNLYIPVSTLNLSDVFDFSRLPEVSQEQRQRCYYALGAALRDESAGSAR